MRNRRKRQEPCLRVLSLLPTPAAASGMKDVFQAIQVMPEEHLAAFLEAVKTDAALQESLKAASDADEAFAIAPEPGLM